MDRLPAVDAHAGRKSLDGGIARPFHVPFARRVAFLRVLADDFVRWWVTGPSEGAIGSRGHPRRDEQDDQDGIFPKRRHPAVATPQPPTNFHRRRKLWGKRLK